jgi:hypothetical protein
VFDLDTLAFASSAIDVDSAQLAALDPVQHGLAGNAERLGDGVQGKAPVVGCLGPDLAAQGPVDTDLLRRTESHRL